VSVRTRDTKACGDPHRGHPTYARGAGRAKNAMQISSNECESRALSQTEHVGVPPEHIALAALQVLHPVLQEVRRRGIVITITTH
jgi:hypothetical protein